MPKYNPENCKGLVFRAHVNQYLQNGRIVQHKELRLLKRRSCPGCKDCEWLLEQLSESLNLEMVNLDNVDSPLMYKLEAHIGTDEYGYVDEAEFEFVETDDLTSPETMIRRATA